MDASSQHQKSMANGFGFNSLLLLSSPFIHTPFPPQLFTQSSHSKPNPHLTVNLVRHLRSSIVSTAENCLRFLDSFASPNPVLDKLFVFFSSHFHDFCQIRRRNYINLNFMANHNFAAIIPGDSVAGIVATNGILNFLNIYNTLLVVRLVLTWFPNSPPAIVSPLSTLCDPYLNIFRGIIPPLGGLDLSPILAFLVLNAFTSAAAALPAELPSTGISQDIRFSNTAVSHLTTSEKKWMRRLFGSRSKSSPSDI